MRIIKTNRVKKYYEIDNCKNVEGQFEWVVQKGGEALIPFESIVNTTRASFVCIESLKKKAWGEIR